MMKSKLLASTLGLALIAGPALAQQADAPMRRDMPMQNGAMPMPAPATTGPGAERMHRGMPHHAAGKAEDGRHRHHHGRMRSERAAARAENRADAGELVQQASAALRAGRTAQARDLLEQSETRLLTRSAPADQAGQPMQGPVLDRLAAARTAIQARDRAGALREMDQAMATLRTAGPNAAGGAAMMRDGGPAGSTMSRADAIIRVQAGGSGSGGVAGSTPGSPGVGNPGSTPSTGMGTTTQPSQGSANPGTGMGSGSPGVGAPPPGAGMPQPGTPQQGSGRGGLGGTTIQPGSPSGGGGTGGNPTR